MALGSHRTPSGPSQNGGYANGAAQTQQNQHGITIGGYVTWENALTTLIPLNPPPARREDVIAMFEAGEGQGWKNSASTWVKAKPTALSGTAPQAPRRVGIGGHRMGNQQHELKGNAQLEGADPQHRFGQWTKSFWLLYEGKFPGRSFPKDAAHFFQWLDSQLYQHPLSKEVEDILNDNIAGGGLRLRAGDTTKGNLDLVDRFYAGVRYMKTEAQRKKYLAVIRGRRLWRQVGHGNAQLAPFDTTQHYTVVSGMGWAIFVRDQAGNFYTHSHKAGRFHHSSFLAGGPVSGAGEWAVSNGFITKIKGKSGHYQPGMESLHNTVRLLRASGATFSQHAEVLLFKRAIGRPPHAMSVGEFLSTDWRTLLRTYLVDRSSQE